MHLTTSNRHGTDPYAWWCGRGETVRGLPIPILWKDEVVEEFGCSACPAVRLGVQSEMDTSIETHSTPGFHTNLSVESIHCVLSKNGVNLGPG
jgi:hypothetical protein